MNEAVNMTEKYGIKKIENQSKCVFPTTADYMAFPNSSVTFFKSLFVFKVIKCIYCDHILEINILDIKKNLIFNCWKSFLVCSVNQVKLLYDKLVPLVVP